MIISISANKLNSSLDLLKSKTVKINMKTRPEREGRPEVEVEIEEEQPEDEDDEIGSNDVPEIGSDEPSNDLDPDISKIPNYFNGALFTQTHTQATHRDTLVLESVLYDYLYLSLSYLSCNSLCVISY